MHNRRFVACIPLIFPDWLVTASFYTAVHAVNALLLHDGVTSITSHDTRNRVLINTNRYQFIWERYHGLYVLSRAVRYAADQRLWVQAQDVEKQVFQQLLYPVERSVQKLLRRDLKLPTITLAPA